MNVARVNACCGLLEISNLSNQHYVGGKYVDMTPAEKMKVFCSRALPNQTLRFAHAIFTQAGSARTYGKEFAAFIVDNKLGTVVETRPLRNPNSGNQVIAFMWTPNKAGLTKWYKAALAGKEIPAKRGKVELNGHSIQID